METLIEQIWNLEYSIEGLKWIQIKFKGWILHFCLLSNPNQVKFVFILKDQMPISNKICFT